MGSSSDRPPGSRKPEAGDPSFLDAERTREEILNKVLELGPTQVTHLQGEFPALERIQVEAAWLEVATDWFEDPSATQTEKDGGYFYTAARRRLMDLVATEAARRAREKRWSQEQSTHQPGPRIPPEEAIRAAEAVVRLGEELAEQVPTFLKPDENLVYRRWLEGERRTEVFAKALGIPESTPVKKQRRKVKKVKDRLMKRLGRDWRIQELAEPLKDVYDDARRKGLRT
ncbi:MAG: sigma-70 family RNA polymerase sigma factor [Gemmatimonadales bacterium]|nr:MAG: sigma-70 family RNA polymerase sigma factor [Gemmatimonadales bacterium]